MWDPTYPLSTLKPYPLVCLTWIVDFITSFIGQLGLIPGVGGCGLVDKATTCDAGIPYGHRIVSWWLHFAIVFCCGKMRGILVLVSCQKRISTRTGTVNKARFILSETGGGLLGRSCPKSLWASALPTHGVALSGPILKIKPRFSQSDEEQKNS